MNKIITLDLDDFLYCSIDKVTFHINNISGSNFSKSDITDYDYTQLTAPNGISPKRHDLRKAFLNMINNNDFRTLKVISGARELTEKLKKDGFYIILITARVIKEDGMGYSEMNEKVKNDTIYSLKENGICYDKIFFINNKFDLIEKIKPIAHGDDAIKHLRHISCHKILMDAMHNKKEKAHSVTDFSNKPSKDKIIRVHDHEGTYDAIKACIKFY